MSTYPWCCFGRMARDVCWTWDLVEIGAKPVGRTTFETVPCFLAAVFSLDELNDFFYGCL